MGKGRGWWKGRKRDERIVFLELRGWLRSQGIRLTLGKEIVLVHAATQLGIRGRTIHHESM